MLAQLKRIQLRGRHGELGECRSYGQCDKLGQLEERARTRVHSREGTREFNMRECVLSSIELIDYNFTYSQCAPPRTVFKAPLHKSANALGFQAR